MIQRQVPSAWRRATPDCGPGQALGGDGAIGQARGGEGQVAADHGRALLADGEFPARRHRAGKVCSAGVCAAQHLAVTAIDDGPWLIRATMPSTSPACWRVTNSRSRSCGSHGVVD